MAEEDEKKASGGKNRRGRLGGSEVLASLSKLVNGRIFGTDPEMEEKADKDVESIRNVLGRIGRGYRAFDDDGMVDFFAKLSAETAAKESKNGNKEKQLIPMQKIIERAEQQMVSHIMFMEMDRIARYDVYDAIDLHIPQVSMGLDTYVDNILSPDDFTKSTLNLSYEGPGGEDELEATLERLQFINETYKVEGKAENIIKDTLKYGDQFVASLSLDRELRKLVLSESNPLAPLTSWNAPAGTVLTESEVMFDDEELAVILEGTDEKDKVTLMEKARKAREEMAALINENVSIQDSVTYLTESEETHIEYAKVQEDMDSRRPKEKKGKADWKAVGGSVFKVLDPRRIVKLEVDGVCYGYYYIEKMSDVSFGRTPMHAGMDMLSGPVQMMSTSDQIQAKTKADIIANMFVRHIGKRINNEFITKNPEFRSVCYNLLHQGYVTKQKMRITYFSPDEVEHFKVGSSEYGVSLFKRILFVAKLYMAVLTSTLMNKLVRGPDKRVFYVEIGLDNDIEATIESFIKDIKSKDLRLNDLGDLTTIMNVVGQFHDLYIPVVNGEKPVEMETIAGQDTQLDNDFLEYLRKTMISGMGVPASMLNYAEEIDFARSISMANGKFVRSVVRLQRGMGESFSSVFRRLYRNEYMADEMVRREKDKSEWSEKDPNTIGVTGTPNREGSGIDYSFDDVSLNEESGKKEPKGKKGGGDNVSFDLSKIYVRFPPPASLNMTNMSEQISAVSPVVQFIVDGIIGSDTQGAERKAATLAVNKQFVKTIDWKLMEHVVGEAINKQKGEDLLTGTSGDTGESGM
jgi:hypothetical protein